MAPDREVPPITTAYRANNDNIIVSQVSSGLDIHNRVFTSVAAKQRPTTATRAGTGQAVGVRAQEVARCIVYTEQRADFAEVSLPPRSRKRLLKPRVPLQKVSLTIHGIADSSCAARPDATQNDLTAPLGRPTSRSTLADFVANSGIFQSTNYGEASGHGLSSSTNRLTAPADHFSTCRGQAFVGVNRHGESNAQAALGR